MSEPNPLAHAAPVEILMQWEGPAINEPGVLFEEAQVNHLGAEVDVAAVAGWVAVAAISGVVGNATHEAIKEKVLDVLSALRRRFGKAKIDEVKQHVLLQVQKHRNHRKITDEELRERIDLLFNGIRG